MRLNDELWFLTWEIRNIRKSYIRIFLKHCIKNFLLNLYSFANCQVEKFMVFEIISGTSGLFHVSSINVFYLCILFLYSSVVTSKNTLPVSSGKHLQSEQDRIETNSSEINLSIYSRRHIILLHCVSILSYILGMQS